MGSQSLASDSGSYITFLNQIKADIQQSQLRAASSVTMELTQLYWRIGKGLSERVTEEGWGAKTIERILDNADEVQRVPSFPSKQFKVTLKKITDDNEKCSDLFNRYKQSIEANQQA